MARQQACILSFMSFMTMDALSQRRSSSFHCIPMHLSKNPQHCIQRLIEVTLEICRDSNTAHRPVLKPKSPVRRVHEGKENTLNWASNMPASTPATAGLPAPTLQTEPKPASSDPDQDCLLGRTTPACVLTTSFPASKPPIECGGLSRSPNPDIDIVREPTRMRDEQIQPETCQPAELAGAVETRLKTREGTAEAPSKPDGRRCEGSQTKDAAVSIEGNLLTIAMADSSVAGQSQCPLPGNVRQSCAHATGQELWVNSPVPVLFAHAEHGRIDAS